MMNYYHQTDTTNIKIIILKQNQGVIMTDGIYDTNSSKL